MKKERKEKKTVGQISIELAQKDPGGITYAEQAALNMTDYEKNLIECADKGKKVYDGDFYICIINKIEPLLRNVCRNYFAHLPACPTPDYDQTLVKYNKKDDSLEFLWTIPTRSVCIYLKSNALLLENPEEKYLLRQVMNFSDGTYYNKCKELNNEKKDSCFKEK
jgi:hypothetical protein